MACNKDIFTLPNKLPDLYGARWLIAVFTRVTIDVHPEPDETSRQPFILFL
jgi:hypothetical protein